MKRLLLVFLFLLIGSNMCLAKEKLKLSVVSGKVPLTVQVIGPQELIKQGVRTFSEWVGCGMVVDWGDNVPRKTMAQDCSENFTYVYKIKGVYKVTAYIWHPGRNDAPIVDWVDSLKVHVR